MRIDVKTLPVNEIIEDIAECLGVKINTNSGELIIEIPEKYGRGSIRGISFGSGVGYINYNCTFYKDVEIHFSLNTVHPLKFIFCSQGNAGHSFQEAEEVHTIEAFQNIIVSSSGYNGHVLFFKANVPPMSPVWKSFVQFLRIVPIIILQILILCYREFLKTLSRKNSFFTKVIIVLKLQI